MVGKHPRDTHPSEAENNTEWVEYPAERAGNLGCLAVFWILHQFVWVLRL